MVKYFVSYRGVYTIKDEVKYTEEERDIFSSDIVESEKVVNEHTLEALEEKIRKRWDLDSVTVLFFKELYDE